MLKLSCWLLGLLLLLQPLFTTPTNECNSIDIVKPEQLQKYQTCEIIVGHVRIWLPQSQIDINIATNIVEITDYLLVRSSPALANLSAIFPKLVLIRGEELLFDEYALVVHGNRNLTSLGLGALQRIQRGSIRIQDNPQLCYLHTVNWIYLMNNATNQHFYLKNNKNRNHCPFCKLNENDSNRVLLDNDDAQQLLPHCWGYNVPQKIAKFDKSLQRESCLSCGKYPCESSTNSRISCKLCATLKQSERCVDKCSQQYLVFNKRECIAKSDCSERLMFEFENFCLRDCPKNTEKNHKYFYCKRQCHDDIVIRNSEDLELVRNCGQILNGSLEIELSEMGTNIIEKLDEAFKNIETISGYLKITNSPQLLSLHFLRNLKTIAGNKLFDKHYSLYVLNNHHIENLWPHNYLVSIPKGHLYFHLNPRLCYCKIKAIESWLTHRNTTIFDVSRNSNGERVVCQGIRELKANVTDVSQTEALIKVEPMKSEDLSVLIGYIYYYKEAPEQNVSMYDGRHGCGHDSWHMDLSVDVNVRYIIHNLKPYTQYAYFVKTLTRSDYHMQMEAYSKIQYFRTMPSRPTAVSKIYTITVSDSEITVHWWPPRQPNGIIERYILHHELLNSSSSSLELATNNASSLDISSGHTLSSSKTCDCPHKNPADSGTIPDDEAFYRKQQVILDEGLPNLIYIPRKAAKKDVKDEQTSATGQPHEEEDICASERREEELNAVTTETPTNADQHKTIVETNTVDAENGTLELNDWTHLTEKIARIKQDNGTASFVLKKPLPLCKNPNSTVAEQNQQGCGLWGTYVGIEVPGNLHSSAINKLQPETKYRLSIRACAANVVDGCGPETIMIFETITKEMMQFFGN